MTRAAQLFSQLQDMDEHARLEAKASEEMGKSVLETMCAFANEPGLGGGTFLLGVRRNEDSGVYQVVGIKNPDKLQRDLSSHARTSFNEPVRIRVFPEKLEGKTVLLCDVEESPPYQKPVFIESRGLPKGAFRRIGSVDQRCTNEDIAQLFALRMGETHEISEVPDSELSDLDLDLVSKYRRLSGTGAGFDDADLLRAVHALGRGPNPACTLAGLILFGSRVGLRRCLPMTARVDYIQVPTHDWVANPDERYQSVDFREGLVSLIPRLIKRVMEDIPKRFSLPEGAVTRQDQPLIPEKVIREGIVNALMHRSYRTHQPVQIIRYPNRLEIRNPGYSLKEGQELGEPGSVHRNPKMAALLLEMGFAETKGTGIKAMQEAMRESNLSPPKLYSNRDADQFILTLRSHHFLERSEDRAWLDLFKVQNLTDNEARILIEAREQGRIDNSAVRNFSGLETLEASRLLKKLTKSRILQQKGKARHTYYVLERTYLPEQSLGNKDPSYRNKGANSRNNDLSLGNSGSPNSRNKDESLGNKDESLGNKSGSLGNNDLLKTIQSLGKRASPDQLKGVLEQLCQSEPRSREELSILVGRQPRRVRTLLSELVQEGRLVYTLPLAANHPQQAYRANPNLGDPG